MAWLVKAKARIGDLNALKRFIGWEPPALDHADFGAERGPATESDAALAIELSYSSPGCTPQRKGYVGLKQEIEFEMKLRALFPKYGFSLKNIVACLSSGRSPHSSRSSQSGTGTRKVSAP